MLLLQISLISNHIVVRKIIRTDCISHMYLIILIQKEIFFCNVLYQVSLCDIKEKKIIVELHKILFYQKMRKLRRLKVKVRKTCDLSLRQRTTTQTLCRNQKTITVD